MKLSITNGLFCLAFLISGVLSTAQALEYTLEDPFYILKQEISEQHKILSFETRRISASYPSSVINRAGANFPGYRGPGQLVVYRSGFGSRTGTNEYGTEAIVENGVVVKLSGADSVIPRNGFVVSGHGSSKAWIKNNLKIGTNVIIEGGTIIAYTTPDSVVFNAKEKIKDAESFINNAKRSESGIKEDKKAVFYLKKAKVEYKKAERAKECYKKEYADASINMSNLAIKYALPYDASEFKGVWLRPVETSTWEIRRTLDEIEKTGIKEIFLETFFHGYTIYPSKIMKSYGLTFQNPKFIVFDPLKVYVDEAHKRGMKVHCWFESFYIGNTNPKADYMSILSVYPSWGNRNLANYASEGYVSHRVEHNGYFLDPANPEVIAFLNDLVNEISTKYKIDGINLDYTRYPNSQRYSVPNYEQSNWGYTEFARNEFKELYGIDPVEIQKDTVLWKKWSEYRQNKIYNYVRSIRETIGDKKSIMVSAVVFPDYDVSLETKQQDWSKWTKDNLVDAVTPLIMTSDNELFYKILKDVNGKVYGKTKVITGLFVGFLDAEPEDLLRQISVSRALKSNGIVMFDWAHLPVKYQNVLKSRVFLPRRTINP